MEKMDKLLLLEECTKILNYAKDELKKYLKILLLNMEYCALLERLGSPECGFSKNPKKPNSRVSVLKNILKLAPEMKGDCDSFAMQYLSKKERIAYCK